MSVNLWQEWQARGRRVRGSTPMTMGAKVMRLLTQVSHLLKAGKSSAERLPLK